MHSCNWVVQEQERIKHPSMNAFNSIVERPLRLVNISIIGGKKIRRSVRIVLRLTGGREQMMG